MQEYKNLLNEFEKRLVDLFYDFRERAGPIELVRVPKISQLLCVALRIVSVDDFVYIREILLDYRDSVFQLLLKYVRDFEFKQQIKKLCDELGIVVNVQDGNHEHLMALAQQKLAIMEGDLERYDNKVIEHRFAIEGITPIIQSEHITGSSKDLFQKARKEMQQSMESVREKKKQAAKEIPRLREFLETLKVLVRREGEREGGELEKQVVKLWRDFHERSLALVEAGRKEDGERTDVE